MLSTYVNSRIGERILLFRKLSDFYISRKGAKVTKCSPRIHLITSNRYILVKKNCFYWSIRLYPTLMKSILILTNYFDILIMNKYIINEKIWAFLYLKRAQNSFLFYHLNAGNWIFYQALLFIYFIIGRWKRIILMPNNNI